MNGAERPLAAFLEQAVGEPPHAVQVAGVLARARRQRRVLGAQVGVASAVLVAAGVASLALLNPGHSQVAQLGQSPTPGPSPSAAATTPAGLAACRAAGFSAHLVSTQGAAGTMRWAVNLPNTSNAPCRVDGYPTVRFHTSSGWLSVPAQHGGYPDIAAAPRAWTVGVGSSLSFLLYWSDVTAGATQCQNFDRAEVSFPGDSSAAPFVAQGCVTPTLMHVGPLTTQHLQ